jgi:hypothetical protein
LQQNNQNGSRSVSVSYYKGENGKSKELFYAFFKKMLDKWYTA